MLLTLFLWLFVNLIKKSLTICLRRNRKEQGTQKKEAGESGMLNKFHEKQQGMERMILEQLVPQDHLLRKIDRSDRLLIHSQAVRAAVQRQPGPPSD